MIKSRRSNYLKSLAIGYLATLVGPLVALWYTPIVLDYLDREEYGLFVLASSLISWIAIVQIGAASGLMHKLAHKIDQLDDNELNIYVSTTFSVQFVTAIIACGLSLLLLPGIPDFFNIRPSLQQEAIITVLLLVISFGINTITRPYFSLLIAYQRIYVLNIINLLGTPVNVGLTLFFLVVGFGVLALPFASILTVLMQIIMRFVYVHRMLPQLRVRWRYISWDKLKELFGFGGWYSLGNIARVVIGNTDRIVIGRLLTLTDVTVFSLTQRPYTIVTKPLTQITDTIRPTLGQMLGNGNIESVRRTYNRLYALSTGLSSVVAIAVFAGNETFVMRWVGAENYGGPLTDAAFAFALFMASAVLPHRVLLEANLEIRSSAIIRIIEAILNIALSISMTLAYGIFGTILSTGIAAFISSFIIMPFYAARVIKQPPMYVLRKVLLPNIMSGIFIIPVAIIMRGIATDIGGYEGALVAMISTGFIGFVILWFIGFDSDVRRYILNITQQTLMPVLRRLPFFKSDQKIS